jgi:hypothetical protein
VDHVYLTEIVLGSESGVLKPFTTDGFLHLSTHAITLHDSHLFKADALLPVYDKCIRELKPKYNWIAFFDLNEFLLVRECGLPDFIVFHTSCTLKEYIYIEISRQGFKRCWFTVCLGTAPIRWICPPALSFALLTNRRMEYSKDSCKCTCRMLVHELFNLGFAPRLQSV